jgi:hypothetical protein
LKPNKREPAVHGQEQQPGLRPLNFNLPGGIDTVSQRQTHGENNQIGPPL